MQTLGHAGKRKKFITTMVMQRTLTKWVTDEQQSVVHVVPQCKRIITDDALNKRLFPTLNGGEENGGVAKTTRLRRGNSEVVGELGSII
jgi:hypothetical protein